jgi:hypothetical protein
MSADHRAMTEHRLAKSRRIVERQRQIVATRRAAGQPTSHSETVLATFERSHAAFERCLEWLVKEAVEADTWPTKLQARPVGRDPARLAGPRGHRNV